MRKDPAKRHRVVAVAYDGVHPFELAVPCEVFGLDRSYLGVPWYHFSVATITGKPVRTSVGFQITTGQGLRALDRADTIVIPGWEVDGREVPAPLIAALQRAHRRGARLLSVCSGAFVLAAAGLLDGRRATTHWMHAPALAERFPDVDVEPGVLYVDEGQVLTSAGTAAGIDLCLHVVRLDFGAEIANAVARRMVVQPHRDGGQAQYVEEPVASGPGRDLFSETLEWMQTNLADDLSVARLAERSAMSTRTFARRFRAATGTTPQRWLLRQRVLLAQRLLETTDDSVEVIASRTGLGSGANFRHHFRREVRTTPASYRRTFRTAEV